MSVNDLNNTSHTDWNTLEKMTDEEIDYSDIPTLTEEFFDKAILRIPGSQVQNFIELDADVMAWFKSQSEEYQTMINEILRRYIESNS